MKRLLVSLLCMMMLVSAAFAEEGVLRMVPQTKYVNTNVMTPESCPNVVLTPYGVYERFTACSVEPMYVTFPMPEGAQASSFDLDSVHALDVAKGIQYTWQISNDYSMEDLLIDCENDEDILHDGTDGVAAYISPDRKRAYALVNVSGIAKRTRVRITLLYDDLRANASADEVRRILTEGIEAEIARVQAGTVARSDVHWSAPYKKIRMQTKEYTYVDLMLRIDDILMTRPDGKQYPMDVLELDDDRLLGLFWMNVGMTATVELEIDSGYSYIEHVKKEHPERVHAFTLSNGAKGDWYVPYFGSDGKSVYSIYLSFVLTDKADRQHDKPLYLNLQFSAKGFEWEDVDEFLKELEGMAASVSVVDPSQDPYVPGPEKTEPAAVTAEPTPVATEPENAEAQPGAPENWTCLNCGTENSGKFCTECGSAKPWICPACGKPCNTNFCPEDGTPKP